MSDTHFNQLCKDQEIFDGVEERDEELEWEMNDPDYFYQEVK